jgi:hypothetical protein
MAGRSSNDGGAFLAPEGESVVFEIGCGRDSFKLTEK